jgi:four helix bundle protein
MAMKKTSERGFEFSCALIDEFRVRPPADDAERHIWWQLLDAGYSIGANTSESGAAESDPDFVHKFQVALKEGRECLYWLRLLKYACRDRAKRIDKLYAECDEIVAILVTSIKTKKSNMETKNAGTGQQMTRRAKREPREFWFNVPE